ncbi:MAG: hypothetical protein KDE23_27395, partial [Caldilinea sp.]|nr:hypothetical protein [Caldilinea sp.]
MAEQRRLAPDQLTIRYREDVTFPTLQRSFVRFVIAAPADAPSADGIPSSIDKPVNKTTRTYPFLFKTTINHQEEPLRRCY